jgi:signal transduction histidine kinase/DNA-binding response OmpR family regulator/HPt (histidine-containing phosphotransfer) domain-containing protein
MLIRLSRFLFWLAACAAGLALLGPARHGPWLTGAAGLSLACAWGVWRLAAWRQREDALAADAALPASVQPDESTLLEVATRVTRAATSAGAWPDAFTAVARVLSSELGPHHVNLVLVQEADAVHATVVSLTSAVQAGVQPRPGSAHRIRLDASLLGEAIRDGRIAGRHPGTLAVPVEAGGRVVAVLELGELALVLAPAPVQALLELTRVQLAAAQHAAAPAERSLPSELLEQVPVSLFVSDPADGRILGVSRHAGHELGIERAAAIGRTPREAFGDSAAAMLEPALLAARDASGPVEHEFDLPGGTGTRTVNVRHIPLRRADGSLRAIITLARDLSVERQTQRELQEAQEHARDIADSLDDSLFVSNPQRSRFEFLAGSTFETWGMSREQFAARPAAFLDNVVEEDRPILEERYRREQRGEDADVTFRIQHPDKGVRWLRSRTRTRTMPDGSLRVLGRVADVTHDRQRQHELERARDAAQAASEAKSQFMANMSHEIRTPMNGILGMTELLLGTALNDKQRRFAQAVYRSGESLLEIINDILDFSKIEAGKLELAPTDFLLRGIVEDTLELLAPRAHERGLELSFREESGLPAMVHGDPLRLRQVLTNLVANAIKFTEHGEVVVDVRRAAVAQGEGESSAFQLEFDVRDTGIGIPADVLPRLFNAFTQANGGMSRRYGGTGLGLAISRQLVELMGGTIEVRSAPGIGSEFRFTVRLQATQDPFGAPDTDGADTDLSALRALVVEDNPTNRTVLENMLVAWGMHVTLAEDGRQALALLVGRTPQDPPFDVALIDMQMPHLDGIGLARALHAAGIQPDMKLVLLSSVSSPDDVRSAHDAGFDRFVAKPIRKAELRQALLGVTSARAEGPASMVHLNRRVLVVEDNSVNQEVIGQMLRRLGCEVQVAASATEGLRALCERSFDLVLMDIQMPGMDGIEALQWLRRGGNGRYGFVTPTSVPVVAVTANALGADEQRFLDLGFDDYLSKPFRQSQLLAMLTRNLMLSAPMPLDEAPEPGAARPAPAVSTTPAALAGAAVLDETALERLRALDPRGENRLLERVLKAFETSVARLLPQLLESRQLGDQGGIRHVAHTLKSSSASIGALQLSQFCADMEAMIRVGKVDDLDTRVDALCAEVEIVLQALRALLEGKKT